VRAGKGEERSGTAVRRLDQPGRLAQRSA
jgi:hypothetical protein